MTDTTITITYSCPACGVKRQEVKIPSRLPKESILDFMDRVTVALAADHAFHSPLCTPKHLENVKIPVDNWEFIGGPRVH